MTPRRLQDFHDVMRHRVMDVLLVASPYDAFRLGEAGELAERVLGEFRNLDLHYGPGITPVSTGAEALALAREQRRFNLILSALQLGDMNGAELARRARQQGVEAPVLLLAFDNRELQSFLTRHDLQAVDRVFLWQGDARILLAMVKYVEDARNAAHDTQAVGVQVILLVEDNVRYYSSFLPAIYGELLHHSQRLVSEAANLSEKILRMRARPKILLCSSYERAWEVFESYEEHILGVVSDIEFPRGGSWSPEAGLDLAREIKRSWPDIPVLLQSSRPENEARAREAGAEFLLKGSATLLAELRRFMLANFGFGDFVFRLPDGRELGRAADLRSLEEMLRTVPAESVGFHAERNHFSKWLKARTEFALADALRPRKADEFGGVEGLRRHLIGAIADYRLLRGRSVVADLDRESFDGSGDFHRIGGGSLGGKASGLAFVRRLLSEARPDERLRGVRLGVPAAVVLGTGVFDRFLEENDLADLALQEDEDAELERRFLAARFPEDARADLRAFLGHARHPLAVRSSSLLEDSQYHPFTGVYDTFMLPNNHPFLDLRLEQLLRAVKKVYASSFSRRAKAYVRTTPFRLEEEKMAVIVQRLVGAAHGSRYYPDFAGVARSRNYYPTPPLRSEDGVAAVALGLGRTVVEGGNCLRFCPRHPRRLVEFSSVRDALSNSQREFWALDLGAPEQAEMRETRFPLEVAEADGTLAAVASTYSAENDAVYDGVSRAGPRLVSFAPVLKHGLFPLAEALDGLLDAASWGMGAPVELEFAVTLGGSAGAARELAVLQLRPLALTRESEDLELPRVEPERVLCRSENVLGHGRLESVRDVVVVDRQGFDRAQSQRAAEQLARVNAELAADSVPYLLIGVGRWGSSEPWLGIPVAWEQISGARVIVEAGFEDFRVSPSQGTHFFQNLTSFNVGYFTVNPDAGDGYVDWDWLRAQPARSEACRVRHLRFGSPLDIRMDGRRNAGLVLKP